MIRWLKGIGTCHVERCHVAILIFSFKETLAIFTQEIYGRIENLLFEVQTDLDLEWMTCSNIFLWMTRKDIMFLHFDHLTNIPYWTKFRRIKFSTPSRNFDNFVRFLPDFCIEMLDNVFVGNFFSSDKILRHHAYNVVRWIFVQ